MDWLLGCLLPNSLVNDLFSKCEDWWKKLISQLDKRRVVIYGDLWFDRTWERWNGILMKIANILQHELQYALIFAIEMGWNICNRNIQHLLVEATWRFFEPSSNKACKDSTEWASFTMAPLTNTRPALSFLISILSCKLLKLVYDNFIGKNQLMHSSRMVCLDNLTALICLQLSCFETRIYFANYLQLHTSEKIIQKDLSTPRHYCLA